MSDTDDTDVLLLIPPRFFLVRSSESEDSLLESSRTVVHKPQSCTAQVLGKLVGQVHCLENRLESLEISSTITDSSYGTLPRRKSFDTDSFDRKCFTFPRRRRRKNKRDRCQDLSLTSIDSISARRRNIPRLRLKHFEIASVESKATEVNGTISMDGDISSIVSTPSKKNDKLLLHEIDEFLTKVESYESPETKFKDIDTPVSSENVIKATSDYLSHKFDGKCDNDDIRLPSGRIVHSSVLDKYIYLVKNNTQSSSQTDKAVPSTSNYLNQQNIEPMKDNSEPSKASEVHRNVPENKSPSIRKLTYENKDVQPTSTPKKQVSTYTDTFKPSSNKIYDRASKVLEQYKSQNYSRNTLNSVPDTSYLMTKDEFKLPKMRPYVHDVKDGKLQSKLLDTIDTDLLSLSELWGEKGDRGERGDSGRLEEEKLKREHCELMIQQLQKKILNQQEKLAVAISVDRGKDAAIAKLKDAWVRLTASLDRAEDRHRAALEKMVREVENFKTGADESQKKTNHFEAELYKALDLAHDYQDKCKQLTADTQQLQDSAAKAAALKEEALASKDKELEALRENYETVMRLNKQSTECLKNLEEALGKERLDHELTKNKINELNRKIQVAGEESALVTQERELLRGKVAEERARGDLMGRQVGDLQGRVSELLSKCDTQDAEIKTLRKHLEFQKNELKTHYQKQLEDAVLAKLQEFQKQLESAERDMENDARGKESAIADAYHKQMIRIEEQHKLEVNLLEEKQREEIKLCRLQLAQASEKIGLLESKVDSYRRRRGQIASQLHGVMEAQWRQALRILTTGHPPAEGSELDVTRPDSAPTPAAQDYAPPKVPPLTLPAGTTRPARDAFNFEGLSDRELQQYVKLLLTKPPQLDGSRDSAPTDLHEEPTSDRLDREPKERGVRRGLNVSKPPWKA